mmetsp:Transcript_24428/g.55071  ORF Transcript_24428/g.55071 Transcript_24428/m.55071 type:complete len:402 (+) Transcript_24428:186-1391(+)|eukprot:CAMPEP_0172587122 /NCGR_PEP_ID=MMETSP1068-20121228/6237_1 /TAXON_ID=35684 /ORGANISM="Pseudopedinella elastica, Strain CCMP716" /LENGTH=401 /DNA_ID=CAMNT_0013382043 /DNA_START=110 /DNA_END=1315 /DNA_ORIENTATION=-
MSGNEQLVANLRTRGRFGLGGAEVATEIEEAFLSCDRASFLREDAPPECYQDRPFRHGHFHHSAPSIYAAALVDFEFPSKQTGPPPLKLLVIGSGTGYFCHLAACLCRYDAVIHGAEINGELVEFSRSAASNWLTTLTGGSTNNTTLANKPARPIFFHVDAFLINPKRNIRYDKIYIAAGAPRTAQNHFAELLCIGGIMIGPFGDQLLKVTKTKSNDGDDDILVRETLSHVSFAPLIGNSSCAQSERSLVLQPALWGSVDVNISFAQASPSFRQAVLAIHIMNSREGLPGKIPIPVWNYVLEFCAQDWFDKELNELELLRALYERERAARKLAESQLREVTRERDRAFELCMMMRVRLMQAQGQAQGGAEEEDANDNSSAGGSDSSDVASVLDDTEEGGGY